jgi:hypothetical protein
MVDDNGEDWDETFEVECGDGGTAEISSGMDAKTKLDAFRNFDEVRLSMDAMARNGHFAVGVGLDPEQAREIAYFLIARADNIDEEEAANEGGSSSFASE